MNEIDEKLEKALVKNYLKVQKKELEVIEKNKKLLSDFGVKSETITKTLEKESSVLETNIKKTEKMASREITEIMEKDKLYREAITSEMAILESHNKEEFVAIEDAHAATDKRIKSEIETINMDYQKKLELKKKSLEKELLSHQSEIEKAKKNIAKESMELETKFKAKKKIYDELVESINAEKNLKIDTISHDLDKKVEALLADIAAEEARFAKESEQAGPSYQVELTEVEREINHDLDQYDAKFASLKSTLESKIARHEKFMNKNIKDNDQRAAKQHRKEIILLRKNGEKELRLLTAEFNNNSKDAIVKRKEFVKNSIEQANALEKKSIEFREEKRYLISLQKAESYSEIERVKFEYGKLLLDQQEKFDIVIRDHDISNTELIRKNDKILEEINQAKILIDLNVLKAEKISEQEYLIGLKNKEKEIKNNDIQFESKTKEAKLQLKIAEAKLEFDHRLAKQKLVHDMEVASKNNSIEIHKLDFERQNSIIKGHQRYQLLVNNMMENKARFISEYHETEINNRYDLKLKFMEEHKESIKIDKAKIFQQINAICEMEHNIYKEKKTAISKDLLKDLKQYESKNQGIIERLVLERDTLESNNRKNESKELTRHIEEKIEELRLGMEKRNDRITSETSLLDKGLEEVAQRQGKLLVDYELYYINELSKIQIEMDQVQAERETEIARVKEKYANTTEQSQTHYNQASIICEDAVKESNDFLQKRINADTESIRKARDLFASQQAASKQLLDDYIAEAKVEKEQCADAVQLEISHSEEEFEAKINVLKEKMNLAEEDYNAAVTRQTESLHQALANIDKNCNNELSSISSQFLEKENGTKANVAEIDRSILSQDKNLDALKKTIKKDYDASLMKELTVLNQRLVQELKAI